MKTLFTNAYIFTKKGFIKKDFYIFDNLIHTHIENNDSTFYDFVVDCTNKYIIPGFVDVHVHLREPGFSYKETIKQGTKAASKGGYTTICPMPNVSPCPSNFESLKIQLDLIKKDATIKVIPYGTITSQQNGRFKLSEMEQMKDYVIGFSDDGKGIQSRELMLEAMKKAKALNMPIVAHCEDESLINNGYIHDGLYAKEHNHLGICSKSEWIQVQRDIELVKKTNCQYHVCHVSTLESINLIKEAKAQGLPITCETAPHYLILSEDDLKESGNYKMNPPLRSLKDKEALLNAIKDHTINIIATDHAPHSEDEKNKGLKDSLFGIVGLETSFQVLYTKLVKTNFITLERLIELLSIEPRSIFNLPSVFIEENNIADFTIIDLDIQSKIDSSSFLSMGKSTPFDQMMVYGQIVSTYVDGKEVYHQK